MFWKRARSANCNPIATIDDSDVLGSRATLERLKNTFGLDLLRMVAQVSAYLAHVHALNTQNALLELHDEEQWWDEVKADPITTKDILEAVPEPSRTTSP